MKTRFPNSLCRAFRASGVSGLAGLGLLLSLPAQSVELGLPIDCRIGEDCWVVNYPDLDPGDDTRDYRCGKATYNTHKGVDIAVRDNSIMREGVDILAAADGTVVRTRDGMQDINVNEIGLEAIRGKQCGNVVSLSHGDGWYTEYCHLRQNSILVKKGDRVKAGQSLGKLGLSGLTEFPHIHMHVLHNRKVVDPFLGLGNDGAACGADAKPLWKADVAALMPYKPTALHNVGFATAKPEEKGIRDGLYQDKALAPSAPALVIWAEIFNVQKGDKIELRVKGPGGFGFATAKPVAKKRARQFLYYGRKRKTAAYPKGDYTGTIRLIRRTADGTREVLEANRIITVK
ncbi:MAG: M23 family metallopeptidase [Magnetovibrionaceae bacterium]